MWLAKSDPTFCAGVEFVYTTGPPPAEYFGSSPYWKDAIVGRPFGFAEPENPAPPGLVTDGAPVMTGVGTEPAVAVPCATVLAPPASVIETVVE